MVHYALFISELCACENDSLGGEKNYMYMYVRIIISCNYTVRELDKPLLMWMKSFLDIYSFWHSLPML